ncbi:MPV17L [Lepeophtheirus salmonis]|uniref:MPV17L n=1 Tax=Lepeophtheirus salmonis TaxID=72036 RepID=A0A7R8CZY6_LEPSM|nr:MPV17L [Lepeophtheirus salmonis]CAF2978607.1 MPV17L [Lepeophtheirus salmonis]
MPLPKIVSAIKLLRHGSLDLFVRSIIFGRGRRRRFGVPPTIRTVKKWVIAHPLISNCCFYGVLFTAGELSRQILSMRKEKNKKPLDFGSVQRCAVLGTVVFPPIFHQWYKWLDSRFPKEGQEDPLLECKEKFLTTFFVPSSLRVVYLAISTFIWFNVLCLIKSIPASDFKRAIIYK